jgi:hypothetical protein
MVHACALVYRRRVDGGAAVMTTFEGNEAEGGSCPLCARRAELLTCCECGFSGWIIGCAHRRPRRFGLTRGRRDGSGAGRVFCDDCARVPPPLTA